MKPALLFVFLIVSFGCSKAPQTVATPQAPQNSAPPANDRPQTVISHSTENQPPASVKTGEKTKWTQSGEPIDTKSLDTAIAVAEVALKKKSDDPELKKKLAEAYYERAVALTDARQYASALGDYRRAVKYDPSNAEAKGWIDQIINIYDGMGRESPKEGEEPPPLQFKKAN